MDLNLYFSPKGRIGPSVFQQSAIILIVIGFVLNMLNMFVPMLMPLTVLAGFVLLWPWICLWVKRLHDAGKSGWMLLLVIFVMIVLSMISSFIVRLFVKINPADVQAAMANAHGFAEMMKAGMAANKPLMLPNAIAGVIVQLIVVLGGNAVLKSDPEENHYGPPAS